MLHAKFDGRVNKMLQLIDEFLFYAAEEKELLDIVEAFLGVCKEIGIKVHAEKSLFTKNVNFCGRNLSKDGVQYPPKTLRISRGYEISQNVTRIVATPMHYKLDEKLNSYVRTNKSTTTRPHAASILQGAEANKKSSAQSTHDDAFQRIKSQLAAFVKLAHPKPD